MIRLAYSWGYRPKCVLFDGWYSSLDSLKLLGTCGWTWLTRLKSNHLVRVDQQMPKAVKDTPIAATGTQVWLPGYRLVKVLGIVATDGDIAYWATNALEMSDLSRLQFAEFSWAIEHYHRGIKQCTGIERYQCRSTKAQQNHIGLALRTFLRVEAHCFARGISWMEANTTIIRDAVRAYLARPRIGFRRPHKA